jgi:hypothetical protein
MQGRILIWRGTKRATVEQIRVGMGLARPAALPAATVTRR